MANEIENIDSSNDEMDVTDSPVIEEADDVEVLKEKFQKLSDANQKLYARTKKAEGFEQVDGKWVKPPKEIKPKEEKPFKAAKEITPAKSDDLEFNSGDKALLRSYDIKGADEIALAKSWMRRTGDAIEVMAEDDIFKSKLGKLRDAKATADALPKGKNRGSPPAANNEDYWLDRIDSGQSQLNDIPDKSMREKVLDKRIAKEKSGSKFAPQGIIMNN